MREVAGSTPGLDFYILCEPICVSLCLPSINHVLSRPGHGGSSSWSYGLTVSPHLSLAQWMGDCLIEIIDASCWFSKLATECGSDIGMR
jgi:hypothetical protein